MSMNKAAHALGVAKVLGVDAPTWAIDTLRDARAAVVRANQNTGECPEDRLMMSVFGVRDADLEASIDAAMADGAAQAKLGLSMAWHAKIEWDMYQDGLAEAKIGGGHCMLLANYGSSIAPCKWGVSANCGITVDVIKISLALKAGRIADHDECIAWDWAINKSRGTKAQRARFESAITFTDYAPKVHDAVVNILEATEQVTHSPAGLAALSDLAEKFSRK